MFLLLFYYRDQFAFMFGGKKMRVMWATRGPDPGRWLGQFPPPQKSRERAGGIDVIWARFALELSILALLHMV